MKTIKLVKTMGVMAHEKKPVWSVKVNPDYAHTSETVNVYLPDYVTTSIDAVGDMVFWINGERSELMSTNDGRPVLTDGNRYVTLKEA